MRPAYWVPPALWMAVVLWLGSGDFSSGETGFILGPLLFWLFPLATPAEIAEWHGFLRKLAHVTVYAILALLWFRAFTRGTRLGMRGAVFASLAIAVAWACVDEGHQALVPSRTSTMRDVFIDVAGASGALGVVWIAARGLPRLTSIALWTASVGGLLLIVLDLIIGVRSGLLWAAVPVAWVLLLWHRRSV